MNNWPAAELPSAAIDGQGQKYLNFAETNTGIIVTPSAGPSIATGIKLWTANDAAPRDPTGYEVWGTNADVSGGGPFSLTSFTIISMGELALPDSRNAGGAAALEEANSQTISFDNTATYNFYMIIFPDVKDSASANSMQIAEIQLDGTIIPEPASASLLFLGLGAFLFRRRRS